MSKAAAATATVATPAERDTCGHAFSLVVLVLGRLKEGPFQLLSIDTEREIRVSREGGIYSANDYDLCR